MATAKKLPSGSWRIRVFDFKDSDGKKHYKSFTCDDPSAKGKRKCEAMAAEWAVEKENQTAANCDMLFKDCVEMYISERSNVLSPATIRKYKDMQEQFGDLEKYKVSELNQDIIQEFVNKLSLTLAPKTVRDRYGFVKAVIGRFAPAIIIKATLPKQKKVKRYIPSEDEVKKLFEFVKGTDMELPILFGSICMMRRSEICALSKSDFNGNTIHIYRTMVMNDDAKWVVKIPKTYAGDREIVVPQKIVDDFMALPGDTLGITPNIITSKFTHILDNAGLPHFRFHDLRHFGASARHSLNIPDAYTMESGGWGDDRVLKEVYRHTLSGAEKKMNEIVLDYYDEFLGKEKFEYEELYKAFEIVDKFCKEAGKNMDELKQFVYEKKKEYDTKYDTK